MRGRRFSGILAAGLSALALGGCGSDGNEPASPQEEPTTRGTSVDGRKIFTQRCSSCHTLADAKASGTVGPNLDEVQPEARRVQQKVRAGGGGMPAFAGQLTDNEIQAVAEYVASAGGK